MTRFLLALAALLVAVPLPAFAQAGERVETPAGGVSIATPPGWELIPPDESFEALRGIEYDSPTFRRMIENGTAPMITLSKNNEDNAGAPVVPTLKISYRRFPVVREQGVVAVLQNVAETMRQGFPDVEMIDLPAETTLAGLPAGHMSLTYSLTREGETTPTISEMWIVARGDYAVIIGVGYPRDEPPATRAEIDAAIASVRIEQ